MDQSRHAAIEPPYLLHPMAAHMHPRYGVTYPISCAKMQAEALDSGSGSILYGVRLPEDMPPGMAYLEVEQGPFVSGSTPVLVMPPQRVMASAEVLQLMRGTPIAATGLLLGEQCAPFCTGVMCCVSCALWVAYVSPVDKPRDCLRINCWRDDWYLVYACSPVYLPWLAALLQVAQCLCSANTAYFVSML